MASPDPIISATELGCAQPERDAAARDPAFAPLDERSTDDLLNSLRALAPLIRFYADSPDSATGDWLPYLPTGNAAALDAMAAQTGGGVAPHHALILAFLRQLTRPQALLNRFTAEHLQFQMQRVLGFRPLPPQPDRAHLVLELKKGTPALAITPAERFTAGKDALKIEQLFAPLRSTVISQAKVKRLASIARDANGQGQRLLFAPIANSADGLGAPLDKAAPRWPPFGRANLPPAPIGFAFASSVLRLAEGKRGIGLHLRIGGWPAGLSAAAFAASFEAHLSGPAGWLGPLAMTASLEADLLHLSIAVAAGLAAIVDHDPAIHLHDFPASLPVIQCLLKPDAALGYGALAAITLGQAQVTVKVSGLRDLQLESDEATLSPKKAFLPFGAQPVAGSRFHIGCAEALGKTLSQLSLHIVWQGAPADLSSHYLHYSKVGQMSNGIGATASWRDASGASHSSGLVTLLPRLATPLTSLTINANGSAASNSSAKQDQALRASARAGFITLSLLESLLHGDFRREALQAALPPASIEARKTFVPTLLNEPYTPKIQEITLDYAAHSDVSRIGDPGFSALTDTDVQFFQIDALGLAREQAWLTLNRPWAPQSAISLLPAHPAAAELLIGLSGVQAGDSVSLLMQVAEGSADPLASAQKLQWSVLADNAWRPLAPGELSLDSSHNLRRSGLVACVLPKETSISNSRAPSGLVWLRAATPTEPRAACDVIAVLANALEVQFQDQGNDPQRLRSPLAAGQISKLRVPLAAIKAINQPFASFGGALIETDAALARRASERLRHRDRAITPWDIERLVLQAFPAVYRAKCIPHANETSWLAAGHFMLVVVPDLRQMNAVDPLQPRVDLDTLSRIREFVLARVGPQTQVHLRNPGYQAVQLDFKLRLRAGNGLGFNFLKPQIEQALRQALSPWAFDTSSDSVAKLGFGGRVLRSALLDFVEELPDVDFVTDFRLYLEGGHDDLAEIVPAAPDVILVSAASHRIVEL
jgi:hypothetical protein